MQDNNKQKFLIIDGNALVHRAYHAIPTTLYTNQHELVNAVYGFTSMLLNTLHKIQFTYVVCTFDMSGPTFRNEMYSEYKANRKKMDDDLVSQLQKIREIVEAFNIPIFERQGYEADDLIGSLVGRVRAEFNKGQNTKENNRLNEEKSSMEQGVQIVILSGDRDILQLLASDVQVILPGKTFSDMVIFDKEKFFDKYHFDSENLIDFKALYGDKSDNIPGVPGIGEKGATDLISEYKTLDAIYENISNIKSATQKKLVAGKESAYLSKKLATIDITMDIDFDKQKGILLDFDKTKVTEKFLAFEFKTLMSKIPDNGNRLNSVTHLTGTGVVTDGTGNGLQRDVQYKIVMNEGDLNDLISLIEKEKMFSIDTETDSLGNVAVGIVGLSVGFSGKRAFYVPVSTSPQKSFCIGNDSVSIRKTASWKRFKNVLENEGYKKIAHNAKFDMHVLLNCGIKLNGLTFDTMLASYILGLGQNDLKSLGLQYEGVEMGTFTDLTSNSKVSIYEVDQDALGKYACCDADITYRLYQRFSEMLNAQENIKLKDIFYSIEMPLICVLLDMERIGIKVDVAYMATLEKYMRERIAVCMAEIYAIVGHEFNINSPKQLSVIIFDELGLPRGKKTKTGYSTDERYFNSIGDVHPIIKPLRLYKELTKLTSTYVSVLPALVDKESRIHTSYNQAVAATGRLSSTNPNLQNIPVKSEIGNSIRKAFIADAGSVFVSFDYSQIELRIVAHMSGDKNLIKAFTEGIDIHTQTAQLIFKRDNLLDVSYEERRIAKTINFGILYGISAFGLAGELGIPRSEAQDLIDRYYATYNELYGYIEEQKERIMKDGYVESLFGRRRVFANLASAGSIAKNAMLREAINMPIQGTNADIIKIAMNRSSVLIKERGYRANLLLQVHDELIFEYCIDQGIGAPEKNYQSLLNTNIDLKEFIVDIKEIMEDGVELLVPIRTDAAIGITWGSFEDVKI